VDVFHTVDVRRTDKDFSGWKVDRKIEFLDEFQHIINETLEAGYSAILSREDYKYYQTLEWPRKARKDSQYTILCRACIAAAIETALRVPGWANRPKEPRLHIVLEAGHPNADDALRMYNTANQVMGNSPAMAGLTFGRKGDSLPLAAADLFAYSAYTNEMGAKPIGIARKPTKSNLSYRGNLHHIRIGRQTLDDLYRQSVDLALGQPFDGRQSS
jgi:hypothetical protein